MDPIETLGKVLKLAVEIKKMCEEPAHARVALRALQDRVSILHSSLESMKIALNTPPLGNVATLNVALDSVQLTVNDANKLVSMAVEKMKGKMWKLSAKSWKTKLVDCSEGMYKMASLVSCALVSYHLTIPNAPRPGPAEAASPVGSPVASRAHSPDGRPAFSGGDGGRFDEAVIGEMNAFWDARWRGSDVVKRAAFFSALEKEFGWEAPPGELDSDALLMRESLSLMTTLFKTAREAKQVDIESMSLEDEPDEVVTPEQLSDDEKKAVKAAGAFIKEHAVETTQDMKAIQATHAAYTKALEDLSVCYASQGEAMLDRHRRQDDRKRLAGEKKLVDMLRLIYKYAAMECTEEIELGLEQYEGALESVRELNPGYTHQYHIEEDDLEEEYDAQKAKKREKALSKEVKELKKKIQNVEVIIEERKRHEDVMGLKAAELKSRVDTLYREFDTARTKVNAMKGTLIHRVDAAAAASGPEGAEAVRAIFDGLVVRISEISDGMNRISETLDAHGRGIEEARRHAQMARSSNKDILGFVLEMQETQNHIARLGG